MFSVFSFYQEVIGVGLSVNISTLLSEAVILLICFLSASPQTRHAYLLFMLIE